MIITEHFLNEHRTPAGGWTRSQFKALGIHWPPPRGWKELVLGVDLAEEKARAFAGGDPSRPLTSSALENVAECLRANGDSAWMTIGVRGNEIEVTVGAGIGGGEWHHTKGIPPRAFNQIDKVVHELLDILKDECGNGR